MYLAVERVTPCYTQTNPLARYILDLQGFLYTKTVLETFAFRFLLAFPFYGLESWSSSLAQGHCWESIPPMSVGRSALAAAAPCGRGPVATGGAGDGRSCEGFDEAQWRWRSAPGMALGRHSHAAVAVEGLKAFFGGLKEKEDMRGVFWTFYELL